ncbi:nuclear transport factor 2 family protein [Flavobacterium sp. ALJ2]|uniref:nuclear transport factor 2 family protein n=1 Tax=Flavobacterium sp. ALJ2 TaxID=2786960 RepID=UPI00189CB9D4|nr:nuclear transport factor 2 family protein [Flavobacterium sp. ALJ2]MBF7090834.1 nuclear transport factor 2 family protein [Flavobacterium sp. ALJ2]
MSNKILVLLLLSILSVSTIFAQKTKKDTPKLKSRLYYEIKKADSTLFAAFNRCDTIAYKNFFIDDLEFYHDLGGLTTSFKNELASFKKMCARGSNIRRELVESSLEVYPIKDYGAVEIAIHNFYHTNKGEKEKPSGTYKFIHVWQHKNGEWRIARIISYGHDSMKND